MKTLHEIELEAATWRNLNFPGNETPFFDSHEQLIGMVEEIGELWETDSREAQADALGDLMIYTMGYCQRRGWSLSAIVNDIKPKGGIGFIVAIGKLAHSQIKTAQKIRLNEDHDAVAKLAIAQLVNEAEKWALHHLNRPLLDIVHETWKQVSQRNWITNPVDGVDGAPV